MRIRSAFGGATGYQVLPSRGMGHSIGQPCSVIASPRKCARQPIITATPNAAASVGWFPAHAQQASVSTSEATAMRIASCRGHQVCMIPRTASPAKVNMTTPTAAEALLCTIAVVITPASTANTSVCVNPRWVPERSVSCLVRVSR